MKYLHNTTYYAIFMYNLLYLHIQINMNVCNNNNLIKFAEKYNNLCHKHKELENLFAPQVVFMGSQSSGKSTTANKLIKKQILPTGKSIVTRTPIHINLFPSTDRNLRIVMYTNKKMDQFDTIIQNNSQLEMFTTKLMNLTVEITGSNAGISDIPIYIDLYWNEYQTNFSFIDLPGRVLIANSDQSETVTRDIDNLIKKYVTMHNTIVMVVIQCKTDLVTDSGLALFKKIEKEHNAQIKAIGILTKPDTMNQDDINILHDFVRNKIDGAVSLSDGYFVVNNKSSDEKNYFVSTFGNYSDRYGIENLDCALKKHLLRCIEKFIPIAKNNMEKFLEVQQCEYYRLGGDSLSEQGKHYIANNIVTTLCERFICSIDSKHLSVDNIGGSIGNSVKNMNKSMQKIIVFDQSSLDYFKELVTYSRGYRMTSHASLEEMIDRCLKDTKYSPTNILTTSVTKCVSEISIALTLGVDRLINCSNGELVDVYPHLGNFIRESLKTIIGNYCDKTLKKIQEYLKTEDDVVWSTDLEFTQLLNACYSPEFCDDRHIKTCGLNNPMNMYLKSTHNSNLSQIDDYVNSNHFEYSAEYVKNITSAYYKTIIKRACDIIPRNIIFGIVLNLKKNIVGSLLLSLSQSNFDELLCEDQNIIQKKQHILQSINDIIQLLQ